MNAIYFTAMEVASMLGVSRGQAYKLVKGMNEELAKKGYIVIPGKVPKSILMSVTMVVLVML